MTIDAKALQEILRRCLCGDVVVAQRPDGDFTLRTHFRFPDGGPPDPSLVFLQHLPAGHALRKQADHRRTGIRGPRTQGTPPIWSGRTVILLSVACSAIWLAGVSEPPQGPLSASLLGCVSGQGPEPEGPR